MEASSTAPSFATSVPNGIPGPGMCGNQTTGRQIYPGAYIKQEKPGAAPPRPEPRGALPSSPPGEQAHSTVSTATPSLEGTLLAGPLLQVREVVTKHLLSRPRDWQRLPSGAQPPSPPGAFSASSSTSGTEVPTRAGAHFRWRMSQLPPLFSKGSMTRPPPLPRPTPRRGKRSHFLLGIDAPFLETQRPSPGRVVPQMGSCPAHRAAGCLVESPPLRPGPDGEAFPKQARLDFSSGGGDDRS